RGDVVRRDHLEAGALRGSGGRVLGGLVRGIFGLRRFLGRRRGRVEGLRTGRRGHGVIALGEQVGGRATADDDDERRDAGERHSDQRPRLLLGWGSALRRRTPSARSAGTTLPGTTGTTGTTGATGTTGTAGAALTWAARAVALPAGTVPLTALARRPRGRDRLPGGRCGRHPCL